MALSSAWLWLSIWGALGAIGGSGAACLAYRLGVSLTRPKRLSGLQPPPRPVRLLRARSACPACGTTIPLYRLVPLLSGLLQRGRAACCGARLDPLYAPTEACGLALGLWTGWRFPLAEAAPAWAAPAWAVPAWPVPCCPTGLELLAAGGPPALWLLAALLALAGAAADARWRVLPWASSAALAAVVLAATPWALWPAALMAAAVPCVLFWLLARLGTMGGGDWPYAAALACAMAAQPEGIRLGWWVGGFVLAVAWALAVRAQRWSQRKRRARRLGRRGTPWDTAGHPGTASPMDQARNRRIALGPHLLAAALLAESGAMTWLTGRL